VPSYFASARLSTDQVQRLPLTVEIGPVMRLGDVLAARPGDPPIQPRQRLQQPTVAELFAHLSEQLRELGPDEADEKGDDEKKGGGALGPERPSEEAEK